MINTPARGIGKTTLEHLTNHARRYGIPLLDAARESGLIESLNKRAAVAVAKFVAMIDHLGAHAHDPIEELLGHLLTESGMRDLYEKSDDESDQERLANIEELLTAARQFDEQNAGENSLEEFLEQSALFNDTDDWETEQDKVTLMTMHAAKGLEFPVVYLIAVEDGILPHQRSMDDRGQMEEERRLMFVAITRAQERLQLSRARKREFRGQRRSTIPSTFLMELPRDEMEMVETEPERDPWQEDRDRWDDDSEFIQDAPQETFADDGPAATVHRRSLPLGSGIVTAAALGQETESGGDHIPPENFRHGMMVVHPRHGVGTVVALGGTGEMRSATIKFDAIDIERKIILKHNNLRPADGK